MNVANRVFYLLLRTHSHADHRRAIYLISDPAKAQKSWTAGDRISPVFPLESTTLSSLSAGKQVYAFFFGPIYPGNLPELGQLYLSLGLFNAFSIIETETERQKLHEFLSDKNLLWEEWTICGEDVREIRLSPRFDSPPDIKAGARFPLRDFSKEVRTAVFEYSRALLSVLNSASQFKRPLTKDLVTFNSIFYEMLTAPDFPSDYAVRHGYLTVANAALSRQYAQTYAGAGPIVERNFYYQSDSLLGIGTASLAVHSIVRFIRKAFEECPIVKRVKALEKVQPTDRSLYQYRQDDKFWENTLDVLAPPSSEHRKKKGTSDQILPLLTCISSRDGFRTTPLTLSVPRDIITGCNTPAWTLLTATHEVSHCIIAGVLGTLLPNPDNSQKIEYAVDLLHGNKPRNLLEQLSEWLCFSLIMMDSGAEGSKGITDIQAHDLRQIIQRRWREANEVLSHTFDYLYFYRRNPELYVNCLWASWAVIPNIRHRLHEYIVRTIAALHSHNVVGKVHKKYDLSVSQTLDRLKEAQKRFPDSLYITDAVKELESHSQTYVDEIKKMENLVKLVRVVLFSPELARILEHDDTAQAGKTGYHFGRFEFPDFPAQNPLRFIEAFATDSDVDQKHSAWILQHLAFSGDV